MGVLAGRTVAVVGGGIGGLAAACYLARDGARVRLIEKNEQLGGRASSLRQDGFAFDMGPSWYLMPDVFERFFGHFGRNPEELLTLRRLDPHYRVFWKDGTRLDVPPAPADAGEAFEAIEPGARAMFETYLAKSKTNYDIAMREFVYRERATIGDFLSPGLLRHARALTLVGSMERHVAAHFRSPKMRQILQYTLVFLGGSPKNTPALYNLMTHVDFNLGVYYPDGGVASVVDAIVDLASDLGVELVTGTEVGAIDRHGGGLVVDTGGAAYTADAVVSNADYAHTELRLLSEAHRRYDQRYWDSRTYAPSAFLLYLGVEGELENLAHHTLVFPTDWDPHFEQIFDRPAWPDDPAYYICVPSRTEPRVAPEGHSSLFVLVPIAPGLDDGPEQRAAYREQVLRDLALHTGTDLRGRIVSERVFSVSDFASRYHSTRGTALGLSHTIRQTSLFRPPHRSAKLPGLYYSGSYTTPGIGMPMALISGEITEQCVVADLGR